MFAAWLRPLRAIRWVVYAALVTGQYERFRMSIRAGCPIVEVRFARDSLLEQRGFELVVPLGS